MSLHVSKIALLSSYCLVVACTEPSTQVKPSATKGPPATTAPSTAAGADAALEAQSTKIASLLAAGDYAAAISGIETSGASEIDKLSASGRLILDGLVDPAAKTKPNFSVDEGLSRLERAAILGHEPSVSDLVGFFTLGLSFRGEKRVFPPSPALAACWQAVQKSTKSAADCVTLRKTLGAPK
jgi:hypothetical protein